MTFLKKILLVDYEPVVGALVRRAFEATGVYQVKEERQTQLTFQLTLVSARSDLI